jgi:hypothetical protein
VRNLEILCHQDLAWQRHRTPSFDISHGDLSWFYQSQECWWGLCSIKVNERQKKIEVFAHVWSSSENISATRSARFASRSLSPTPKSWRSKLGRPWTTGMASVLIWSPKAVSMGSSLFVVGTQGGIGGTFPASATSRCMWERYCSRVCCMVSSTTARDFDGVCLNVSSSVPLVNRVLPWM